MPRVRHPRAGALLGQTWLLQDSSARKRRVPQVEPDVFILSETEVTEIILAKVARHCQLLSHSRGFLSRL